MRIALYARVSTVKQAEKDLSIPDQLRQMRDWCKANRYTVIMEYVEPGASATDDKRPVFQQMIADAMLKPSPYDAIVVHSLSRFFRNSLEFGLYERDLRKVDVKLISITQQTSDDPSGEFTRKLLSFFDEYQSKENSKHTLRAMKENTRQGYFNGSRPTFGYKTVEVETITIKGKKKKRLAIDEHEAATVRKIFDLYLNGHLGQSMGAKQIAVHLNERGFTQRGKQFARNRIHEILSNPTYQGEFIFNKRDAKNQKFKPESEWVRMAVEPIIEKTVFEAVQNHKAARAPSQVPPRITSSPTLLTGLLKCGCCGASMTLATGKGGRYRYYKCNTRISKGNKLCDGRSIPMEKLDNMILNALADKVFDPNRVKIMLSDMKKQIKAAQESQDEGLKKLTKELDEIKLATDRLLEAVEKGFLPLDSSLHERSHKLNARKQELLIAVAGYRRQQQLPEIKQNQLEAFTRALRTKLLDRKSGFGKEYLKLLVSEIRIKGNQAEITGSYSALAHAVEETKKHSLERVPSFVPNWLAIYMSERASESLFADSLYPLREQLRELFNAHGIVEYDVNTVARIASQLLTITPSFETYYRVKDVLSEHLETDPDVIRLTTYDGLQSDLARCITLIAVLRKHCSQPLGGHSLILREAPKQVIQVKAHIHELEHTRDDIPALPCPPEFFEGDVLVCDDFRGLIECLDETAILVGASDDLGIELAVRIALFKYAITQGDSLDWGGVIVPAIGSKFRELCQQICADQGDSVPPKILRSIIETIKGHNLPAVHALRTGPGGNDPQRMRCSDKAQRRDIDREFHLHYWECADGTVELASVVYHNDFSIPG